MFKLRNITGNLNQIHHPHLKTTLKNSKLSTIISIRNKMILIGNNKSIMNAKNRITI